MVLLHLGRMLFITCKKHIYFILLCCCRYTLLLWGEVLPVPLIVNNKLDCKL